MLKEVALVEQEFNESRRARLGAVLLAGAGALAVHGTGAVVVAVIAGFRRSCPRRRQR